MRHHRDSRLPQDPFDGHPTADKVAGALNDLASTTLPGTPDLSTLKTLERAGISPPIKLADREITDWSTQRGRPQHGEKRSDDHISGFEVLYPGGTECPECGSLWREYSYSATHHITGGETTACQMCDHVFDQSVWG